MLGVLIKPNQIGTLSETLETIQIAQNAGYKAILSHRSGETEDLTIVHLGVGWGIKQIKVGSFSRSERMAKWNEGIRIAEAISQSNKHLLPNGNLPPQNTFPWTR